MQVLLNNSDISNYVTSISDIPVSTTNVDYSLYLPKINISIAKTTNTIPVLGDLITVKISSISSKSMDAYYKGYLTNVDYNYAKCVYKCSVSNLLNKLNNLDISYDNLNSKIETGVAYTGGTYTPTSYDYSSTYRWVNAPYLLKCMIEVATGESVDTTRLNSVYENITNVNIFNTLIPTPMLWSVGQDIATGHAILDASPEYTSKFLKFYEIANLICYLLKIKITYEVDTYYLNHISAFDEDFSLSDNVMYAYSNKIKDNPYEGVRFTYHTANATLNAYSGTIIYDLIENTTVYTLKNEIKEITIPNNFMFTTTYINLDLSVWKQSYFPSSTIYKYDCIELFKETYTTAKNFDMTPLNNTYSIKKNESKIETNKHLWFTAGDCNIVGGDTNIPINIIITFNFSMAVEDLTVKLLDGFDEVNCTLSQDSGYFTLTPNTSLGLNTTYVLSVTKVTSIFNRYIETAFIRSFTTI